MERKMEPISIVAASDGTVQLTQAYGEPNEPQYITLHHTQVDVVIEWIKAAKSEAEKLEEEKRAASARPTPAPR